MDKKSKDIKFKKLNMESKGEGYWISKLNNIYIFIEAWGMWL
jgi:hypothetical protein